MTLDRARRVFASHMAAARTRQLTAYEKRELTAARQMLRRSRRPAGQTKVNPKRGGYSVYVFKAGRGLVYIGNRSTLVKARDIARQEGQHGFEIYGPDGVIVARKAVKAPYTPLSRNRPKEARKNPSGLIRMGKLVEIRYQRDIGTQKGYYRHPFKVRPVIYYRPSDNSIWIKGGK